MNTVASIHGLSISALAPVPSVEAFGAAIQARAGAESAPRVLIVDSHDINRRMMKAILRSASYPILECRRASEAMEILASEQIDLVVLDMMLPEMSGIDLCRWLKANRQTQLIPVLMLSSVQGVENEIAGISSGADEFLIKPVNPAVVRARIQHMLKTKALIDSLEEAETILFALAQTVEQRDKGTGMHCQRLASYSLMMGESLRLPDTDLTSLYRGGYLHDIGKISVPDAVLFKPGPLTEDEWVVMRQHTTQGELICKPMRSLAPTLPIIRNHHERWDGSGYPDGLQGDQIPLLARILQVADIFDALTSARSYKAAFSTEEASEILLEEVKRGWRDPELVPLFLERLRRAPDSADGGLRIDNVQVSLANMEYHLKR